MPIHLRYHNPQIGATVVSMPPHQRTLRLNTRRGVCRMWFPHTIWAFRYRRVPGGFMYGGGHSTYPSHLFFRNEPLASFDDELYQASTEHLSGSVVCLEEGHDTFVFRTPMEMVGTIIGMWAGATHYNIDSEPASREEALTTRWGRIPLGDDDDGEKYGWPRTANTLRGLYPKATRTQLIDKPLGVLPVIVPQRY